MISSDLNGFNGPIHLNKYSNHPDFHYYKSERKNSPTMFEYKFEKITARSGFFTHSYDKDYQLIIRRMAEKGWRFIQLVPIKWDGHGRTKEIELIFERPVNWDEENALYAEKTV